MEQQTDKKEEREQVTQWVDKTVINRMDKAFTDLQSLAVEKQQKPSVKKGELYTHILKIGLESFKPEDLIK